MSAPAGQRLSAREVSRTPPAFSTGEGFLVSRVPPQRRRWEGRERGRRFGDFPESHVHGRFPALRRSQATGNPHERRCTLSTISHDFHLPAVYQI